MKKDMTKRNIPVKTSASGMWLEMVDKEAIQACLPFVGRWCCTVAAAAAAAASAVFADGGGVWWCVIVVIIPVHVELLVKRRRKNETKNSLTGQGRTTVLVRLLGLYIRFV